MKRRNPLIAKLIDAARGGDSGASSSSYQLPCFPLENHHFGQLTDARHHGVVATPSDFHSYLCNRIRTAKERIVLASLYIGVGSNAKYQSVSSSSFGASSKFYDCKEDELLQAISDTTCPKVQILLDANRAMRRVSLTTTTTTNNDDNNSNNNSQSLRTNSAEAVYSRINPKLCQNGSGVFLFPVKDERLSRILPSPLDEVAGVFHIKAYILDDELILSGANLSEEYFNNRLDRYMLFTNGGAGLVDFYANLCDILCDYATEYDGHSENNTANNSGPMLTLRHDEKERKRTLELALMSLFNNAKNQQVQQQQHELEEENDKVVAWAIPTLQIPTKLLDHVNIPSDTKVTRNILSLVLGNELSLTSVRLCSAYLNLTDNLMSVLTKNHSMTKINNNVRGASYILTAGGVSHGFSPKRGGTKNDKNSGIVEYIKAAIPTAFLTLAKKTAQSIVASGGKIFLYERPGWIFHAKGIWITMNDYNHDATTTPHHPNWSNPEMIDNPSSLVATIIGSSNFGSRSEKLDLESNCILIFNDSMKTSNNNKVKKSVADEWNQLCEQSNELNDVNNVEVSSSNDDVIMQFLLKLMRRYL